MKCEYCGTVIPDGTEECPACGAGTKQTKSPAAEQNTLPKEGFRCRKCGTINDADSSYCKNCGIDNPCYYLYICTQCGHRFGFAGECTSCPECGEKVVEDPFSLHREDLIRESWKTGWILGLLCPADDFLFIWILVFCGGIGLSIITLFFIIGMDMSFLSLCLCVILAIVFILLLSEISSVILAHVIKKFEGKPLFDENNWKQILKEEIKK